MHEQPEEKQSPLSFNRQEIVIFWNENREKWVCSWTDRKGPRKVYFAKYDDAHECRNQIAESLCCRWN